MKYNTFCSKKRNKREKNPAVFYFDRFKSTEAVENIDKQQMLKYCSTFNPDYDELTLEKLNPALGGDLERGTVKQEHNETALSSRPFPPPREESL